MQPVAIPDDKRLAVTWFPYAFTDYESAEKALTRGGVVFDILGSALADKGLTLLGVYGEGMGGAGFTKPVPRPADPDAKRDLKVRVWPGATTHRLLLQRFGYATQTMPWSELERGLAAGKVDGQIGGTAAMALDNFKAVTKTWVQYNDHFECDWLFIGYRQYRKLSEQDRTILTQAAHRLTRVRFAAVRRADENALEQMRQLGIDVVTFTPSQLQGLADVARRDVWPKLQDEVGEPTMNKLRAYVKTR